MDTAPEPEENLEPGKSVVDSQLVANESTDAQPRLRRARRWPYVAAIVFLVAGLLTLGAGYAYTTNSAEQWRSASEKTSLDLASMTGERDELAQKNKTLTSQLGDTTSKLNDTTSKLNDTATQLNSANDRIRSLANEKAQVGDRAAVLAGLIAASQKVADETAACIHQHQDLELFLGGPRPYDHASMLNLYKSVDLVCEVAWRETNSLTSAIQGLSE